MSTILVVEDNALNMELATDLLEAGGHRVRQAGTAEAGLEIARSEPIDLILMDIRLPGMDGFQALAALRSHEQTAGILTVALTAEAMNGDGHTVLRAGFDGYLSKPIDTRNFLREIARLLGSSTS